MTDRKNGQRAYISANSSRSPNRSNAEPQPNQPGSITRHCVQPNTQGIARKSSMSGDPVRDAGRLPMLRVAISLIGVIAAKKPAKSSSP